MIYGLQEKEKEKEKGLAFRRWHVNTKELLCSGYSAEPENPEPSSRMSVRSGLSIGLTESIRIRIDRDCALCLCI